MRPIAILGCKIYRQIAVAHVTLQNTVLGRVEIFAVHSYLNQYKVNISQKGHTGSMATVLLKGH